MTDKRTSTSLLPGFFRTSTNKKFLQATVDPLIQEPSLQQLYGYAGEQDSSPVFQPTDSYIIESDPYSQHYQLEPALVTKTVKDGATTVSNVSTYLDMLNQVSADGGLTNNHSRLFAQEYYNYSGFIDYDKLVNFSQYYWVPQGPDPVEVTGNAVPVSEIFTVTGTGLNSNNLTVGVPGYEFSTLAGLNPTLTLARGGTYTFNIDQPGHGFTIQTQPGINAESEVYGVFGNGTSSGQIVFNVPYSSSQSYYANMPEAGDVSLYTTLPFNEINNVVASEFLKNNNIGGSVNINNKTLIINNYDNDFWYYNAVYDADPYDTIEFEQVTDVPVSQRTGIWNISIDDSGIIRLVYVQAWQPETKFFVTDGDSAGTWYYKTTTNEIVRVPALTANLDRLYYQDSLNPEVYGTINLVDLAAEIQIDIDAQIVGQQTYTSPGGIVFSNGMIVTFDGSCTPDSYTNGQWLVEGVGTAIRLVEWSSLVTPETFFYAVGKGFEDPNSYDTTPYDFTGNSPIEKDYLVINRASSEGSSWARGNRWFHKDLLLYIDKINNNTGNWRSDNRAIRPIIEFNPDIKLFNHGTNFLGPVSVIDNYYTNCLEEVEGQDPMSLNTSGVYNTDGVELNGSLTAVFANDKDPLVAGTIWQVQNITPRGFKTVNIPTTYDIVASANTINFEGNIAELVVGMVVDLPNNSPYVGFIPSLTQIIAIDGTQVTLSKLVEEFIPAGTMLELSYPASQVHLVAQSYAKVGDSIVVTSGKTQQGNTFWWNGNSWVAAQARNSVNVAPLFDLLDINRNSIGNQSVYPGNNFYGNRLFGYAANNAGVLDGELGFAIKYQSIGNMGDIVFSNDYLNSYTYLISITPQAVGKTFAYDTKKNKLLNGWTTVVSPSRQYLERVFVGTSQLNNFDLNALYVNSVDERTIWVKLNGKPTTAYCLIPYQNSTIIQMNNDLSVGDRLYVKFFGVPQQGVNLYTVPKNLQSNPFNKDFDTILLSQMRNHISEMCDNSVIFSGDKLGSCNLRDINLTGIAGTVLQHSASVGFYAALSNNNQVDLAASIDYNRLSYSQFKNNLLHAISNTQLRDINNPVTCLNEILLSISQLTVDESFRNTDMIAYGTPSVSNTYNIVSSITNKFNLTGNYVSPSFNAVYVYKNGNQLTKNDGYSITGKVVTLNDTATGDIIRIDEFNTTQQCPIPATPSKLGLWPAFKPEIFLDTTYIEPATMIRGHDGSLTLAFGDYRDDILLEFELRIYNNIKVDLALNYLEPGAFRISDYSIEEWTQLLGPSYLSWSGNNSVDIFKNDTISNSLFSYNYSAAIDRLFNENLPGAWRGIYKYFYDTIEPHLCPWEMIGFQSAPSWWQEYYGPAPYTSANLPLWQDLEQGLVRDPAGNYVDSNFIRPGLSQIIPVDDRGELLPPLSSIVSSYDSASAGLDWRIGDQSPQEWAWRTSSEFPFAAQIAQLLARPAYYTSISFNTSLYSYNKDLGQFCNAGSLDRTWQWQLNNSNSSIPGSNIWIQDRITALGIQNIESLSSVLQNIDINLAYKMAGFSDKNYINVMTNQSSPMSTSNGVMVPAENYHLSVTKSAPVTRVSYSAVVITKTGNGFLVDGFDPVKPYFTIIPDDLTSTNYTLVNGKLETIIYRNGLNQIVTVPYGQTFETYQDVSNFLISYGRWLEAQGFQFTMVDDVTGQIQNWSLAVSEFLWWCQLGFDITTVISLSPAGSSVAFDAGFGVVDDITNSFNNTKIINSNGMTLKGSDYRVDRDGTKFNLTLLDPTVGIFLIDLEVVQYEHCLIVDNTTVFNDIIYDLTGGSKVSRLLIQGMRTTPWDGSLTAPGFMINIFGINDWAPWTDYYKGSIITYKNKKYIAQKFLPGSETFAQNNWLPMSDNILNNELIPNMAFNAAQFDSFYDVDTIDINVSADNAARNSTGFVPRPYLTDLGLNNVSQHKFYLGMIREKGTESAINAFLRIQAPNFSNNITIKEQWALKVGDYGTLNAVTTAEFNISNAITYNNDYIFNLVDSKNDAVNNINNVTTSDMITYSAGYESSLFAGTPAPVIDTVGNAQISDASLMVFDSNRINNVSLTIPTLVEGARIWVASDSNNEWAMLRVSQPLSKTVAQLLLSKDPTEIICVTNSTPGLQARDIVCFKQITVTGAPGVINSFFRVKTVGTDRFTVIVPSGTVIPSGTVVNGLIFLLKPVKYQDSASFAKDMPARGWLNNDLVWCNNTALKNTAVWSQSALLTPYNIGASANYGCAADVASNQVLMVAASGLNTVYCYNIDVNNQWQIFDSIAAPGGNFGSAISASDVGLWAIGAPGINAVYIVDNGRRNAVFQILTSSDWSMSQFGAFAKLSTNGQWLYASNSTSVMAFCYIEDTFGKTYYTSVAGQLNYGLPITAQENSNLKAYMLSVTVNTLPLTPGVDFTIESNNMIMTVAPQAGSEVIITYGNHFAYCQTIDIGYPVTAIETSNDGSRLVVGCGDNNSVVVLNRSIQQFISDGVSTVYTVDATNSYCPNVHIDGVKTAFTQVGSEYTFNASTPGSIIEIETNNFNAIATLTPSNVDAQGFGSSLAVDNTAATIYVGSPNTNTGKGEVYKFVDFALLRGYKKINFLDLNNDLVINGHHVMLAQAQDRTVQNINDAHIPNVTAVLDGLFIEVTGPAFTWTTNTSGLYESVEVIIAPLAREAINFGTSISTNDDASIIAIGAKSATERNYVTFDNNKTTFDSNTLSVIDTKYDCGTALIYEYQPSNSDSMTSVGNTAYATSLSNGTIFSNDLFGSTVVMSDKNLFSIAPQAIINGNRVGALHIFSNETKSKVWQVFRAVPTAFDSSLIKRIYLFDSVTGEIIEELPVVDPINGRFTPGITQSIDYQVPYDPAIYTVVANKATFNVNPATAWGREHVGTIWWDTNSIKYYSNQGNPIDSYNYWGQPFIDSIVTVAQWVESSLTPSAFTKANAMYGLSALYTVSDNYAINPVSYPDGTIVNKYYFWVVGNFVVAPGKVLSTKEIAASISNVANISTPYAVILTDHTFAIRNCNQLVTSNTAIALEVIKSDTSTTHSEWSLFDNGTAMGISQNVFDKIVDSLTGYDSYGRNVPDLDLLPGQKYGTGIIPRQSMFVDQYEAANLWVDIINKGLLTIPFALIQGLGALKARSPEPTDYDKKVATNVDLDYIEQAILNIGTTVLVESDAAAMDNWTLQTLVWNPVTEEKEWYIKSAGTWDLSKYWSYADWYAVGYSESTVPDYIINGTVDNVTELNLNVGDIVKIIGDNVTKLVVAKTGSYELVGQTNSTIQLSPLLYSYTGFAIDALDYSPYAADTSVVLRQIFNIISQMLMVQNNALYKSGIETLIKCSVRQNQNCDWVFKTSFLDVNYQMSTFGQNPTYSVLSESIVEDFVNEVKPFHSIVKSFNGTNVGQDGAVFGVTDYDLPSYYRLDLHNWKSPRVTDSIDQIEIENNLIYDPWYNGHTFAINNVNVTNGGSGYNPVNTLVIIQGDGVNASATAVVANGIITRIILTNPGQNYTWTKVSIIGVGKGAEAVAVLAKNNVRLFDTTIKFDRTVYTNSITDWAPSQDYNVGQIVVFNNNAWRTVTEHTSENVFDMTKFVQFSQRDWQPNSQFNVDDIVVYLGKPYLVTEAFISGSQWQSDFVTTWTYDWLDNAMDRVWAYYVSNPGMPGRVLSQIFSGIEFPGVIMQAPTFEMEAGYDTYPYASIPYDTQVLIGSATIDTVYASNFTDSTYGVTPDNISDGQTFVNPLNCYAPEELVNGASYDTLDVKITRLSNLALNSSEIDIVSTVSIGGNVYSFAGNKPINGIEDISVVVDSYGPLLSNQYLVNYDNQTVALSFAPIKGSTVFIVIMGPAGLNTVYNGTFLSDGVTLSYLIEDYSADIVKQCYVKVEDENTPAFEMTIVNNKPLIVLATAPEKGKKIDIHLFNFALPTKANMSVTRNIVKMTHPPVFPADYTIQLPTPIVGMQPFAANIIVRVNNIELSPSNQYYFVSDGVKLDYDVFGALSLIVTVDGVVQRRGVDFNVTDTTIIFTAPPASNSLITISDQSTSQYSVSGDGTTIVINDSVILKQNDEIEIISFSNHNALNMVVQVFTNLSGSTSYYNSGFDSTPYERSPFDNEETITRTTPYQISFARVINNYSNVNVVMNGKVLTPFVDYGITGNVINLNKLLSIMPNTVIVVRHFAETAADASITCRIFKDMINRWSYFHVPQPALLTRPLLATDTWLYVDDVTKLDLPDQRRPGLVSINGEKITYTLLDPLNNCVSGLRRGVLGTGMIDHQMGEFVENCSLTARVSSDDKYTTVNQDTTIFNSTGQSAVILPGETIRTGVLFCQPPNTVSNWADNIVGNDITILPTKATYKNLGWDYWHLVGGI
jgi:hypothetical protein